jgi:polyisoprenoid-binding protein YceI
MKKIYFPIIALFIIVASGFTASVLWKVSNEGVTVSFELPEQGTKGTLSGLKATIDFDEKDLANSKISASVDLNTLNTGDAKKDKHLLSADFFNAEKFPTISFTSTSITETKDGWRAKGNLTMKDSTRSVEIPFKFSEKEDGTAIFTGTMTVFSGDYGVTKKSDSGKDKILVQLSVAVKR